MKSTTQNSRTCPLIQNGNALQTGIQILCFLIGLISLPACGDDDCPEFEERERIVWGHEYLPSNLKNIIPYKGGDTMVFKHLETGNTARFYGTPIDTGFTEFLKYDDELCTAPVYVTYKEILSMKFNSPDYTEPILIKRYIPGYLSPDRARVNIRFHKYYFENLVPQELPHLIDSFEINGRTYYDIIRFDDGPEYLYYNVKYGILKIKLREKYGTFERIL